jgi:hypothetical protein
MPASVLAAGFSSSSNTNSNNFGSFGGNSTSSFDTKSHFPTSFGLDMKK